MPGEKKKREDDKVLHLDPHREELGKRRRRSLVRHQHRRQPEREHHQRQVKDLGGLEKNATAESGHKKVGGSGQQGQVSGDREQRFRCQVPGSGTMVQVQKTSG